MQNEETLLNLNQAASSSPKAPGVAQAVFEFLNGTEQNLGRGVSFAGDPTAAVVFTTRAKLATMFDAASPRQVAFTSGLTAAMNVVVAAWLNPGDHVITSCFDHNAVLRPLFAASERGIRYSVWQSDAQGNFDLNVLDSLRTEKTRALIIASASNVCGVYAPLDALGEWCRDRGIKLIVDSAQTAGAKPLSLQTQNIAAIAFTGHKSLMGPQGIGGLIMSESFATEVRPFMCGGTGSQSQRLDMPQRLPDKLEPGTPNLPGIVGLHAAIDYLHGVGLAAIASKKQALTAHFIEAVQALPGARIVGPQTIANRDAVVSLDFPGRDNAVVSAELAEHGILTRPGLHCAPLAHQALGTFPAGTVRFSFGYFTQHEAIDRAVDALKVICQ